MGIGRYTKTLATMAVVILILGATLYVIKPESPVDEGSTVGLTVSWMSSWATAGQIMTALTRTNIPKLHESKATFKVFLFGPEMNEAARSHRVDVTNTGVVPTVNLLAVDEDWVIVGRLIYFPVSLVVPNTSLIKRIEDLPGSKIGVPFGGGSHPYILNRLNMHGVDIGSGLAHAKLVNLKPPEQPLALLRGHVDALATWEPQTAIAVERSDGTVVDEEVQVGFITVRKSLAESQPEQIVALLKAYIEANLFVSNNKRRVDSWFSEVSQFDAALLNDIKVIEPNLTATKLNEVNIWVSERDIRSSQEVADVMYQYGLISNHVQIEDRLDLQYLERALEDLRKVGTKRADIVISSR